MHELLAELVGQRGDFSALLALVDQVQAKDSLKATQGDEGRDALQIKVQRNDDVALEGSYLSLGDFNLPVKL